MTNLLHNIKTISTNNNYLLALTQDGCLMKVSNRNWTPQQISNNCDEDFTIGQISGENLVYYVRVEKHQDRFEYNIYTIHGHGSTQRCFTSTEKFFQPTAKIPQIKSAASAL